MKVLWADLAKAEAREIVKMISEDNPTAAANWIKELRKRTDLLAEFPNSARVLLDEDDWPIREFIHGNYRVLYEVQEQGIFILHVWHGARLLPWEEEEDE